MANGRNVTTVDFGAVPVAEANFTVTDANITVGMAVEAYVSAGDSTADNTTEDHRHLASCVQLSAGLGDAGSFALNAISIMDLIHGTFNIQYAYST